MEPLISIVDESLDNTDSRRRSAISAAELGRRRSSAISALGALGGQRASETLKRLLKDDKDTLIRHRAARTLGKMKDSSAVESLLQSVKQDPIVKNSSLSALAEIGGARVVEIFASFLDLEDTELKFKAAVFLLDFEDSEAKEPKAKALKTLVSLLDHEDAEFKIKAAAHLLDFKDSKARERESQGIKNPGGRVVYNRDDKL